ncbi:DMSO/selenate family reductase complex A subunit [Desulfolutivibrio sulfoxidireducens]|uniref:DMSO/selenate family reductase complex A subunit n=1 Tax=Desulfolutivibrio sulfoxidireducens TaxID=2773299 RepID=UPI00159E8E43|nr:DMSO/selenate family reductase complex A subunit [Desulfolutivibrio sulfoxidireducens]QLA14789.1 molybdopterin-dependent oxidoreductase [Desulfolutivibrio sulfoxidireducens]
MIRDQTPGERSFRDVKRRDFLKWSALLGGAAALGGAGLLYKLKVGDAAVNTEPDRIVIGACHVNCGNRCPLKVRVRDGRIVQVESDDSEDTFGVHQIRPCLRGRSMRKWVYSPDRLKYPMKRVGKRGEGKFERISWDEALDTVARELRRIIDTYGNEAVYRIYSTGVLGARVSGREGFDRLANLLGGQLGFYGSYSTAQIQDALPYLYGKYSGGNSILDIANTKLAVFFGNNTAATRTSGGSLTYDLVHALRQSKARFIIIDPHYSDTAPLADEWIPIRPGTDGALAAGLAFVLITENMVEEDFLQRYCVGYDEKTMPEGIPAGNSYKEYILGAGPDKTPKTPAWASAITGIPVERIVKLAREIGDAKPCYIAQGWGPQRQANGEQTVRAICMLAVLTGNVGIQGGGTGSREGFMTLPFPSLPTGKNPVSTLISVFTWTKAIEAPTDMTDIKDGVRNKKRLEVPIKFIWNYAGNCLINQHSDINRTTRILQDDTACEMIVVIDNFMTASAKFADILLPACSNLEEDDIVYQGANVNMGALFLTQKAVEPMFESRGHYEIVRDLARRLGVEERFSEGRDREGWIRYLYAKCREIKPDLPEDITEARKKGIFKWKAPQPPLVAFKSFREDPAKNPLATPSGKIEIFSKRLWDIGHTWELGPGEAIPALPEYLPCWEGVSDPLREKYPLQLFGQHYKQRTHSSFGNVPWLQEVAPQQLWINPIDAESRGIKHGDTVRVFNDRGATLVTAKVTPRIMPGVLNLPQGAWYTPDAKGVDTNGSVNILTSHRPSPQAKGNPQHTNLVEVVKA